MGHPGCPLCDQEQNPHFGPAGSEGEDRSCPGTAPPALSPTHAMVLPHFSQTCSFWTPATGLRALGESRLGKEAAGRQGCQVSPSQTPPTSPPGPPHLHPRPPEPPAAGGRCWTAAGPPAAPGSPAASCRPRNPPPSASWPAPSPGCAKDPGGAMEKGVPSAQIRPAAPSLRPPPASSTLGSCPSLPGPPTARLPLNSLRRQGSTQRAPMGAAPGWVCGVGGFPTSVCAPARDAELLCTCCRGWERAMSDAAPCTSPRGSGGHRAPVKVVGAVEAGSTPGSCSGGSGSLAPGKGREVLDAQEGAQGSGAAAAPPHVPSPGGSQNSRSSGAPWGHPELAQRLCPSPAPRRDGGFAPQGCSTALPVPSQGQWDSGGAQGQHPCRSPYQ